MRVNMLSKTYILKVIKFVMKKLLVKQCARIKINKICEMYIHNFDQLFLMIT